MTENEMTSNQVGVSAGQIAMSEYILKRFKDEISPNLERFLNNVVSVEYEKVSKIVEKPAEDIALAVEKLFDK